MVLFAAALCLLIVLPIAWLGVFAFTDRARNVTLANFHTLFTDPAFVEPLLTTLIIASSVSIVCCLVAAPLGWIVARTDIPLARTIRILVMASFVTPPFLGRHRLGDPGGAQQRAPEPVLPLGHGAADPMPCCSISTP